MDEASLPKTNPYIFTPTLLRHTYTASILVIFVPLVYALWFFLWGISLSWVGIGIGALGWTTALFLRSPIMLLANAFPATAKRLTTIIVAFSGPCEELVRLAVILLLGRTFPVSLSIGLGWTAIEFIYAIINNFVVLSLFRRDDEKALQARAMLEKMGPLSLL